MIQFPLLLGYPYSFRSHKYFRIACRIHFSQSGALRRDICPKILFPDDQRPIIRQFGADEQIPVLVLFPDDYPILFYMEILIEDFFRRQFLVDIHFPFRSMAGVFRSDCRMYVHSAGKDFIPFRGKYGIRCGFGIVSFCHGFSFKDKFENSSV